jgi:hypothetical protein
MEGFGEKGAPKDWDTAMGKVQGFRSWSLRLTLAPIKAFLNSYSSMQGWGKNRDALAHFLPNLNGVFIEGMYGGTWDKGGSRDGWYTARCQAFKTELPAYIGEFPFTPHIVPDPDCGCGFWAYWKHTGNNLSSTPWIREEDFGTGYKVLVPLYGVVDGAGATIIGERGFRCGRARITDLTMATGSSVVMERPALGYEDAYAYQSPAGILEYNSINTSRRVIPETLTGCLSRLLVVSEVDITETIFEAVNAKLGKSITWHSSVEAMAKACPPDENYGS